MLTKTLSKMGMGNLGFSPAVISELVKKAHGKRVLIARVGGEMENTIKFMDKFTGEEKDGMQGNFAALSSSNDEYQYVSNRCFLPGYINNLIVSQFNALNLNKTKNKTPVKFAYDIFVTEADNAVGYTYDLDPLIEIELAAPKALAMLAINDFAGRSNAPLLELIAKSTKALAAPVATDGTRVGGDDEVPTDQNPVGDNPAKPRRT